MLVKTRVKAGRREVESDIFLLLKQYRVQRKVRHVIVVHMTAPPDLFLPPPEIFFLIEKENR